MSCNSSLAKLLYNPVLPRPSPLPQGEHLSQTTITDTGPTTQGKANIYLSPASSICHKNPRNSLAHFSTENSYLKNSTNHLPSSEGKLHNVLPRQGSPVTQQTPAALRNRDHLCSVSAHTCAGQSWGCQAADAGRPPRVSIPFD